LTKLNATTSGRPYLLEEKGKVKVLTEEKGKVKVLTSARAK
jgi:hypothetical protein